MNSEPNPYAAPASPIEEGVAPVAAPAMWNPNAAALWSLLFSPVFGAYLQMRNWQSLGDAKNARLSWHWCIGTLVATVALMILAILLPDTHPFQKVTSSSGVALLLAWYLGHGKVQVAYVKERFGKDYPRKPWGAALGIALACVIALLVAAVVLAIVLTAAGVIQMPA